MDAELQQKQRTEVIGAYKTAVRLRLYSRISGLLGIVAAAGFLGAMIIGGIGFEAGVVGIVTSLLVTVSASAKFYDQSFRTAISASGVERSLGLDEDLFGEASEAREKLLTWTVIATAVCAIVIAGILALSFANADTERDDDDDDDQKTEQTEDADRTSGDGEDGDD